MELESGGSRIFAVERIMDKRVRNGVTQYLVKWSGWSHRYNTWEPSDHILHRELIDNFEEEKERKRNQVGRGGRRKRGGSTARRRPNGQFVRTNGRNSSNQATSTGADDGAVDDTPAAENVVAEPGPSTRKRSAPPAPAASPTKRPLTRSARNRSDYELVVLNETSDEEEEDEEEEEEAEEDGQEQIADNISLASTATNSTIFSSSIGSSPMSTSSSASSTSTAQRNARKPIVYRRFPDHISDEDEGDEEDLDPRALFDSKGVPTWRYFFELQPKFNQTIITDVSVGNRTVTIRETLNMPKVRKSIGVSTD